MKGKGSRMHIVNLDEDNIEMYVDFLTPDVAENIGRTFYKGLVVEKEGELIAGMVWNVRNMMNDADNESHISFLKINDEEAGNLLFEEYKDLAREDDVVKTTFSLPAKSTTSEQQALANAGFSVKFMEGDLIKARLSEIGELAFIKKVRVSDDIHSLKTMTQRGFNSAIRSFVAKGLYGLCEDLPYLPRTYFENDVSCYAEVNGQVNGIFLFHKNPSEGLMIVVMAAIGSDFGKILPQMMKFSVLTALEEYSDETEIWIDRHNYASLALSEKLFPRGFGIPVYIGSRQES